MGSLCSSGYETIGDEQAPINIRDDANRVEAIKNIENSWKDDTLSTWERLPSKLPINIDIPRLYKKISIIDSNTNQRLNPVLTRDIDDNSLELEEQNIFEFLETLARVLNDNTTLTFLKDNGSNYFRQQDMAKQLHSLVSDLEKIDKHTLTLSVLKLVNQKIVFPAFYCAKSRLNLSHMKDKRGSWYIDIFVSADRVKVVHRKGQLIESAEDFNRIDVEFTFSLILEIDLTQNLLSDIYIKIPHVNISEDLTIEERERYENLFERSKIIY